MNVLNEKVGEMHQYTGMDIDFLNYQSWITQKIKNQEWDLIEEESEEWDISHGYVSHRKLVSRAYKELKKLNTKETAQ